MFEEVFSKKKKADSYRQVTAKVIAEKNNIEYISKVDTEKVDDTGRNYYLKDNRYILLYPPNDGVTVTPFNWYKKTGELVIDNQSSYSTITNLYEILLQIVKLYEYYLDEDIIISAWGMALKLESEIVTNYHGRASLVLTDDCICNSRTKFSHRKVVKEYFVNDFLDHYISWNFGVVVTENPELENVLIELNKLLIKKGIRKYAGTALRLWHSKDVMPYCFPKSQL